MQSRWSATAVVYFPRNGSEANRPIDVFAEETSDYELQDLLLKLDKLDTFLALAKREQATKPFCTQRLLDKPMMIMTCLALGSVAGFIIATNHLTTLLQDQTDLLDQLAVVKPTNSTCAALATLKTPNTCRIQTDALWAFEACKTLCTELLAQSDDRRNTFFGVLTVGLFTLLLCVFATVQCANVNRRRIDTLPLSDFSDELKQAAAALRQVFADSGQRFFRDLNEESHLALFCKTAKALRREYIANCNEHVVDILRRPALTVKIPEQPRDLIHVIEMPVSSFTPPPSSRLVFQSVSESQTPRVREENAESKTTPSHIPLRRNTF